MDATLLTNIFGYLASVFMVFGYLPQAIVTIRTRNTHGIALPTFLLMAIGSLFFVIQGWMLANWPLVITNIITGSCSAIITIIKIHNDYFRRHQ